MQRLTTDLDHESVPIAFSLAQPGGRRAVLTAVLAAVLVGAWLQPRSLAAQEAATDTTGIVPADTVWTHQLAGGINLTQVALKDWAGGGEDALAWTLTLNGHSDYSRQRWDWVSQYRFAFGQTKLGDRGLRKTDDKIDLETTLTYRLDVYVNPYVSATVKTQFAKGYAYSDTARSAISRFFDPAYLTQTAGFGYEPVDEVRTRLGVGVREVITRDYNQYADDQSTTKVEKVDVDAGVESVTQAAWQLAENILLTSKLEMFAPASALDELTIRSDSNLTLKVNAYVNSNVNLQIVEDDKASPDTQIKEALSVGLSYTFF